MATLQVLCPNGRRQNVKITPNSKLLQVLEEVCKKQGFIPVEDYKLIHGRKDLDLSLSFRFANLPNNAKLELLKLEKSRAEAMVLIALQLESGQRLQQEFPPSTALWDILVHWENQSSEHKGKLTCIDSSRTPPTHPVCIYMVEEVKGECALQRTTLRKLGLTAGRAVVRLVHRPVEDAEIAEIVNKVEKEMVKEARLGEIAARKHSEMQVSSSSESQSGSSSAPESKMSTGSLRLHDSSKDSKSVKTDDPMSVTEIGRQESNMDAEQCDNHSSGQESMDVDRDASQTNAISRFSARSQQPAGSNGQSAIEQLRSLNIPGVEIFTPQDFQDLPPDQQQMARSLAQRMLRNLMGDASQQPQQPTNQRAIQPADQTPQHQFSEFKFPESTKGKNLYKNELSEVNPEEYQSSPMQDSQEPTPSESGNTASDDHTNSRPVIVKLLSSALMNLAPELQVQVTESDLRLLMTDLKNKADTMSEAPLMTKSMRQAKLEEKYSHYKKVVIRVQFSDKLVLQGLFKPRETVFAVQKFVKENLQDKSTKFYLYTTPPKCVLKDKTMTLIEAELVPATRIYFGSEQACDHYLSEAVRAEVSARDVAERVAFQSLPSNENQLDPEMPSTSGTQKSKVKSSSSSTGGSQFGGGKAPKWLKLGKK